MNDLEIIAQLLILYEHLKTSQNINEKIKGLLVHKDVQSADAKLSPLLYDKFPRRVPYG